MLPYWHRYDYLLSNGCICFLPWFTGIGLIGVFMPMTCNEHTLSSFSSFLRSDRDGQHVISDTESCLSYIDDEHSDDRSIARYALLHKYVNGEESPLSIEVGVLLTLKFYLCYVSQ